MLPFLEPPVALFSLQPMQVRLLLALLACAALLFAPAAAAVCPGASACQPPGPATISFSYTVRDFVGLYDSSKWSKAKPDAALSAPANANPTSSAKCNGSTPSTRCSLAPSTHPDFERAVISETMLVKQQLGADRKPVFNSARVPAATSISNAAWFYTLFNDNSTVNMRATKSFDLKWDCNTCVYSFSSGAFFPIDDELFGNWPVLVNGRYRNFGFCMEYHGTFVYRGVEKYRFQGDDDVWFFINDKLWVDLGGVHATQSVPGVRTGINSLPPITYGADDGSGFLPLAQYSSYLDLKVNRTYPFDFFFCERHTTASAFTMQTNMQISDCPAVDACGVCGGNTTADPCKTMQCGNGVCSCSAAACTCNAGWRDGPAGSCSQMCGNGIVEGDEQCDVGVYPPVASACCTAACKFRPRGAPCASAAPSALPCVLNNVCPGDAATCGAAQPIGTACNTAASTACASYQCTAADGSKCELAPTPDTGAVWYQAVSQGSGLCLDAVDGAVGTTLVQRPCSTAASQLFRFVEVTGSGWMLVSKVGRLPFGVSGNVSLNGAPVVTQAATSNADQVWRVAALGTADNYHRVTLAASGKCLDVTSISAESGAPLQQWDCWNGPNQLWKFVLIVPADEPNCVASPFWHRVVNRHSDKCVDVTSSAPLQAPCSAADGQRFRVETYQDAYKLSNKRSGLYLGVDADSVADGARLIQSEYVGLSQKWRGDERAAGGLHQRLANGGSSKCADLADWSTDDGAAFQQWACGDGANQQFRLEAFIPEPPTQPPSCRRQWHSLVSMNSGQCVTAQDATAGTVYVQRPCDGSDAQRFALTQLASGGWTIANRANGLALSVVRNGVDNGVPIVQQANTVAANQIWQIESPDRDIWYRVIASSGKCLDVTGISFTDGTPLQQWACWAIGPNQMWKFVLHVTEASPGCPVAETTGLRHSLVSLNSGKCIDTRDTNTTVVQYACGETDTQLVAFTTADNSGPAQIELQSSGDVLAVIGGLSANGAPVVQESPAATAATATQQLWTFAQPPTGEAYYSILNKRSAKCLDVVDVSVDDGARLQQWDCTGSANQQWQAVARIPPNPVVLAAAATLSPPVPCDLPWYSIVAQHSGKCLDMQPSSKVMQQRPCVATADTQLFQLVPAPGGFTLLSKPTRFAVSVAGEASANGDAVVLLTNSNLSAPVWRVVPAAADGYFTVALAQGGRCLDVTDVSAADGAPLQQWDCWPGAANQAFRLVMAQGGLSDVSCGYASTLWHALVSKSQGKCIDSAGIAVNAALKQTQCAAVATQHFEFASLRGAYRLRSRASGLSLSVANGALVSIDGASVVLAPWNGTRNQAWAMQGPAAGGHFNLSSVQSAKCLDVATDLYADFTTVQQWQCFGGDNQQWQIVFAGATPIDGGYFLEATDPITDPVTPSARSGKRASFPSWGIAVVVVGSATVIAAAAVIGYFVWRKVHAPAQTV